ncbi:MAG: hypothetical protein JNM18_02515, partial [Planctomycetaceae bacterium]|nr:hypothetical protein [Planctomycetaceae bacterium]
MKSIMYLLRIRWFALVTMILSFSVLHAEANPFGLPEPIDSSRPGVVMLHGGGHGLAAEAREEFIRLAGGTNARILLMPSDQVQRGVDAKGRRRKKLESIHDYEQRLSSPSEYGSWVKLAKTDQVASFGFLYPKWDEGIFSRDNEALKNEFYELLDKATGVWLPALDQEWLPDLFASEYPGQLSRF